MMSEQLSILADAARATFEPNHSATGVILQALHTGQEPDTQRAWVAVTELDPYERHLLLDAYRRFYFQRHPPADGDF